MIISRSGANEQGCAQWRFYVGTRGYRPPKSCPGLHIFGHNSSATGWINWFYSKFRLAVVASQMMRGQAPKYFFLEPPLDVHETFLVETEARPRPRPSELEAETRPRHTNSEARLSQGTTAPRDGVETEASRPRPHPCHLLQTTRIACGVVFISPPAVDLFTPYGI